MKMVIRDRKKIIGHAFFIHLLFILISMMFALPFLMVISVSFTNENVLLSEGYKLLPKQFDLMAYRFVFQNPDKMLTSYGVTALQAFIGTILSVVIMALCAYPLSRQSFKFTKPITFYIFFTMLFGGGLVPSYIINTQYFHLGDSIWVYLLPGMVNAFQIIIFRTFFQGLPPSLVESAKIDGASEIRVFFQIIAPLSKPVLATIALFQLLERWNNWMTSLIYIRNEDLYTLQFLLQKILREAEFLRHLAQEMPGGVINTTIMLVLPFFQKYFTRGLTIGAVKG